MIDSRILIGAGIVVGLFVLSRLFYALAAKETEYERELARILESDEYKVRGRFE